LVWSKQSLPGIFPDGMWPIKSHRIRFLNFDDAETAQALDAEHMAWNF
jgi:hypothetical protein